MIPPSIEQVLRDFDSSTAPFDRLDVLAKLDAVKRSLGKVSEAEQNGVWSETLAFGLVACGSNNSPWHTHYGPISSGRFKDGTPFYSPDIAQADAEIVAHWRARSQDLSHPALRARYADLCWDLSKAISGLNRQFSDVRIAIDAYCNATSLPAADLHQAFSDGERAVSLAVQISDQARIASARTSLLALHARAMAEQTLWWRAYDILADQKKAGLSDNDRASLVSDLDAAMMLHANTSDPRWFDPHLVQMTAERLARHYERLGQQSDVSRVHATVARSAEHHASLGNAMLAAAVLQTSMDAYRKAGMPDEVERIRREMVVMNRQAQSEMTEVRQEFTISFDDVEAFLQTIVRPASDETLLKIAATFLSKREPLEKLIEDAKTEAPLYSLLTQTLFSGDHVVATVGSADNDPNGRLLRQAVQKMMIDTPFLGWAIDRAIEAHHLSAVDIVRFANKAALFGDGLLLFDGVDAFLSADFVKATHILVPQIERGFRSLIEVAGGASTKPHPRFPTAQVVITMGDIMYDKATLSKMGSVGDGISLHIAALYADSRARNIRNDLAHGLLGRADMTRELCLWLVHSLLLLGSLARSRE